MYNQGVAFSRKILLGHRQLGVTSLCCEDFQDLLGFSPEMQCKVHLDFLDSEPKNSFHWVTSISVKLSLYLFC